MAYLKANEVRALPRNDRDARLKDLRQELMHERGVAAMGGSPPSPGKIRQLRRQIARILTIDREEELARTGRFHRSLARKAAAPAGGAAAAPRPAKKKPEA